MKSLLQIRDEYYAAKIRVCELYDELEMVLKAKLPEGSYRIKWFARQRNDIVREEQEIHRLQCAWSTLFSGFLRRIKCPG